MTAGRCRSWTRLQPRVGSGARWWQRPWLVLRRPGRPPTSSCSTPTGGSSAGSPAGGHQPPDQNPSLEGRAVAWTQRLRPSSARAGGGGGGGSWLPGGGGGGGGGGSWLVGRTFRADKNSPQMKHLEFSGLFGWSRLHKIFEAAATPTGRSVSRRSITTSFSLVLRCLAGGSSRKGISPSPVLVRCSRCPGTIARRARQHHESSGVGSWAGAPRLGHLGGAQHSAGARETGDSSAGRHVQRLGCGPRAPRTARGRS
jgi:hypothetical protein